MAKKTTYNDVHDPNCECKNYTVVGRHLVFGRSSLEIKCPFCNWVVTAYLWSLAGGGKRCDCGALHTNYGQTYKLKEQANEL